MLFRSYDAAGIRRAAGKQAGVLNNFFEKIPFVVGEERYTKTKKNKKYRIQHP